MAAYQFASLHEVPEVWRTYKGARLTLEQIQWIVDESDRLSGSNTGLASARQKFEETHQIQNDIWVQTEEGTPQTKETPQAPQPGIWRAN